MKRKFALRRVGLFQLLLAVCLCLAMTVDSSLAKKRGGRGRGRGRGRGNGGRGRSRMKTHVAKHTGVHIKLGQDRPGLKKIGVGHPSIRALHERNMAASGGGGTPPIVLSDALKERLAIQEMERAEAAQKRQKNPDGVLILNGQ